jgi:glutamate/tyrosine decarboxylase-like PLP-dependent enzyme
MCKTSMPFPSLMIIYLPTSKGMHGYRAHVNESLDKAQVLSEQLELTSYLSCLSDIHRQPSRQNTMCKLHSTDSQLLNIPCLPIVVFRLPSDVKKKHRALTLSDIGDVLHTVTISIPSKHSSSIGRLHAKILSMLYGLRLGTQRRGH